MSMLREICCPALTQERAMSTSDSPSPGRALVPLAMEPHETHPHRPIRRAASFVTQLIASAARLPQSRERRRAEPAEVIAAYRATVERIQKLNAKSA
jgi:hypothetical protein